MGNGTSKVAFRDVLLELREKDISLEDVSFWSKLWRTESTPHDVFEVISPSAVRMLKEFRPGNVEALLRSAVTHIEKVLENPDPFLLQSGMTAVSVLTRVLPFLLESYADSDTEEVDPDLERMFWSTEALPSSGGGGDGEGAEDKPSTEASKPPVPLGSALVSAAMRMLFTRQLTVDVFSSCDNAPQGDPDNPLEVHDPSSLWSGALGVGRKAHIQRGRDLEANRTEVMRLILALMCEPLFQRNVDFDPTTSRFAQEVCSANVPFASELFFSLLAVVATYDPVGWGVPYAGSFTSVLPERQLDMAVQLLVVLLDYGKPPMPVVTTPYGPEDESEGHRPVREDAPSPGQKGYNVFRNLVLHGLKEEEDFKVLFFGLSRLLNNLHRSRNTYMPGAAMAVSCYQEVLVLLWKVMEENPDFTEYVLKHCDVNEILVPVCYLLVENRKDASKGGLIHICTFLLLKLSGERLFGVAINKPCTVRLPTDLPLFSGSHLDLLVLTVHKLLVAGTERLSTLYHCFLTVLCNVSPYAKSLSLVSSIKLVNLFELFTSPGNLYASETNQTYVSLLLEMFSNIIQYQYTGNARLVYAIVRRQEAFESLFELDLPAAIAGASKFARSGAAAAQKARMALAAAEELAEGDAGVGARTGGGAGAGIGGGGGQGASAMGLKAGPEDRGGRVSASHAVLEHSSGTGREEYAQTGDSGAGGIEQEAHVPLRFRPTQEWLDNVRSEVPFNTIIRLLRSLAPQVEEMCQMANAVDENTMVEFVTNTSMVGLLPVPHPIVIRKYHPNQHTAIWFTAFMWGVVFVYNQEMRNPELPMFDPRMIRLFKVSNHS